jgi:hypothetical protein
VNANSLLLALAGGSLAYYFWKHPQGKASSINIAPASAAAPPGANAPRIQPVNLLSTGTKAAADLGSSFGVSLDVSKLFNKIFGTGPTPHTGQFVSDKNADAAAVRLLSTSIQDVDSARAATTAAGLPFNAGYDYNPGPARPDPVAADNSVDFEQPNSNSEFAYA